MSKFEYECNLDEVMAQLFRIRDGLEVLNELTEDLNAPISRNAKSLIEILLQVTEKTTELAGKSVDNFPPVE